MENSKITSEVFNVKSQERRWFLTINNPFGTDVEEIDITKTDLEIKEDYYNLSYLNNNLDYFTFKYVEVKYIDQEDFKEYHYIVKRPFFKDVESVEDYIESLEHFKYSMFQVEKGHDEETEHIQATIFFTIGKRFQTLKSYFPTAHIEKVLGSNAQVRDYCSKSDTRIMGPFELGTFSEEGARTDKKNFLSLLHSGVSNMELSHLYPSLYMKERNKLDLIRSDVYECYSSMLRDVDVTYVYGDSGVGKSTYVRRKLGLKDTFFVSLYDNSMFTNYKNQDNVVFDEFAGQIDLQQLNKLLDVQPCELRGLNCSKWATYHHVYIISNYSYKELYRNKNYKDTLLYSFNRRIHNIIYIDHNREPHIERETIWVDCENEIDISLGQTKIVSKMIDYDRFGNPKIFYDKNLNLIPLNKEEENDLPF